MLKAKQSEVYLMECKVSINLGEQSSTILLVEDNDHDVFAVQRALEKSGVRNPLIHFKTGEDLFDFLSSQGRLSAAEKHVVPALILLDLNLPSMTGYEVLNELKSRKRLRRIPVIVFSSSNDERDIQACFEAGANSYVVKPMTFSGLIKAIAELYGYWFEIAVLPKVEH